MLTREENELITRVGPDTPMGRAMREYWLPLVLSGEVETDGAPLRVRLLGEDLIAFRDTQGNVGLVDAFCPHRRAPLFFGRNEEDGLRCVYHGWKFDKSGACVDMPSEPPDSLFREKVKVTAYPTRERNGVVWAYLGKRADLPDLPALEWNLVPAEQRQITKRVQYNNWVQSVEGGIDPSHSPFLHSLLKRDVANVRDRVIKQKRPQNYEFIETDYGLRLGTQRPYDDRRDFWSITHLLMPFYNVFNRLSAEGAPSLGGFAWVPMDDATTLVWAFTWNPLRALRREEIDEDDLVALGGGVHPKPDEYLPPNSEPGGAFRLISRRENDYFLDRATQREERFSAVPGLTMQDASLQEGMGPVCDRSQEHLGISDSAIIQARRCWLKAARGSAGPGAAPQGSASPASYRVRAAGVLCPRDEAWTSAGIDWVTAAPDARAPALT